jgi:hypothetical protein
MLVFAVIGRRTLARQPPAYRHPKAESVCRRFQQFFASCALPARRVGAPVLTLAPKPSDGWILAMDRTYWQFGRTHVNIFVVGVIIDGVVLPVAWRSLPKISKRGNYRCGHDIALMEDVHPIILPCTDIRALRMDRKSAGGRWHSWPRFMGIQLVVRVKAETTFGGGPAPG